MKDEIKSYGADLAEQIVAKFQSPEFRQLIADTKAAPDGDTGTFEVVITTENLDRYQEVIKLDGWELEHYRKNAVVLWGHDHSKPIGLATSIEIADGKMVAKGKFAPTAFAQEIRQLYDAGIIKATSVGFIEKERQGNLITKAELLEFSFVSVPANPYALSLAMEKGLGINELVTKGLMFVEQTHKACGDDECEICLNEPTPGAPIEKAEEDVPEPEVPAEEPTAPQERSFSTKQLTPVIDSLRSALVALEALGKSGEPEGDADADEETEEEDAIKGFLQLKGLFQTVDTTLGEVLAEMRSASRH